MTGTALIGTTPAVAEIITVALVRELRERFDCLRFDAEGLTDCVVRMPFG